MENTLFEGWEYLFVFFKVGSPARPSSKKKANNEDECGVCSIIYGSDAYLALQIESTWINCGYARKKCIGVMPHVVAYFIPWHRLVKPPLINGRKCIFFCPEHIPDNKDPWKCAFLELVIFKMRVDLSPICKWVSNVQVCLYWRATPRSFQSCRMIGSLFQHITPVSYKWHEGYKRHLGASQLGLWENIIGIN